MTYLRRLGIDIYMLMLIATVVVGLVLPVRGVAADVLKQITFWAVALRVPQSVGQLHFGGEAGRDCGCLLPPKSFS